MVPLQSISQVVNMYLTITVKALKLNMKVTTTLLKVIPTMILGWHIEDYICFIVVAMITQK